MIGGGLAGLFVGLTGVKAYLFAVPSLIALPQFIYSEAASNITNAMIAAAISIIVTFILAYFLGIDEETSTVNLEKVAPGISSRKNVFSPLSGQILPLEKVNDATFSKKCLEKELQLSLRMEKSMLHLTGLLPVFSNKTCNRFNK